MKCVLLGLIIFLFSPMSLKPMHNAVDATEKRINEIIGIKKEAAQLEGSIEDVEEELDVAPPSEEVDIAELEAQRAQELELDLQEKDIELEELEEEAVRRPRPKLMKQTIHQRGYTTQEPKRVRTKRGCSRCRKCCR